MLILAWEAHAVSGLCCWYICSEVWFLHSWRVMLTLLLPSSGTAFPHFWQLVSSLSHQLRAWWVLWWEGERSVVPVERSLGPSIGELSVHQHICRGRLVVPIRPPGAEERCRVLHVAPVPNSSQVSQAIRYLLSLISSGSVAWVLAMSLSPKLTDRASGNCLSFFLCSFPGVPLCLLLRFPMRPNSLSCTVEKESWGQSLEKLVYKFVWALDGRSIPGG